MADRAGNATLFNVGPTSDRNLLHLEKAPTAATPPTVQAGMPLHILDRELEAPAKGKRLFAAWTRQPLPLEGEQL